MALVPPARLSNPGLDGGGPSPAGRVLTAVEPSEPATEAARPVLLLYHRVCEDHASTPSEFVVTASVFRQQMSYLATHGFHTPRLASVLRPRAPLRPSRAREVVITFDDGYADTLESALPILTEFGFGAAVFPVLDLERRFSWWSSAAELRAPLLQPSDLRRLETAGFEVGSHTLTHPRLSCTSDSELVRELTRSREVLASLVAQPLPVLAYPYGDVNERVKRAAREAGYAAALAVSSGPLDPLADRYEIRRECMRNRASDVYMAVKLSRAQRWYGWSKWKVRTDVERLRRWFPGRGASGAR